MSGAPHHAVPAHVWAEEPDPLDVLGVVEEKKGEVRDLASLHGSVLRTLETKGLVHGVRSLAAGMGSDYTVPVRGARPPRWEGHRLAVKLELRQRGGSFFKGGGGA